MFTSWGIDSIINPVPTRCNQASSMPTPVTIILGDIRLEAELSDSEAGRKIADALPVEGPFQYWGDEIYFRIPVEASLDETATLEVQVGDIGYWPPGRALAVFYGPTPASTDSEPVPASEVNVVGRVLGDSAQLKLIPEDQRVVRVEKSGG